MSKTVLVLGTGTIGEPLIGLISDFKKQLNVENVLFYKRTPIKEEISKVKRLVSRGAQLVVKDLATATSFSALGNDPSMVLKRALEVSDVVIDCTPAGNQNRDEFYLDIAEVNPKTVFVAQGSEKGFGIPYAYGINDGAILKKSSKFIQVVSCNTHNISALVQTAQQLGSVVTSDFVCMRRANDVSQDKGYVASPSPGQHTDKEFGTHHARDVFDLFKTLEQDIDVYSSAIKINTQYMHTLRYMIEVKGNISTKDVLRAFEENKFIALTYKKSANKVFSFGRDHGYYGRIFNQTVVPVHSVTTSFNDSTGITKITGFCYTPQDGNSLLTSMAAVAYGTYGSNYLDKLKFVDDLLFDLI